MLERRLYKVPEVAKLLCVDVARTYELIRLGIIPVVRLGRQLRIDSESLEDFFRGGGKALPGGWKKEVKKK